MIIKFLEDGKALFFRTQTGLLDINSEKITEQEAIDDPENITLFEDSPAYTAKKSDEERAWRDCELCIADIEINRSEDIAGSFNAADWRSYRELLRGWPSNVDFPDSTKRPSAPN